jgi:hypothetical protein
MNVTILLDADRLLLAGYILAVVCLNATMYLISSFYHKKFGEATPRAGFALSMVLSVVCAASVFVNVGGGRLLGFAQSSLLILGSGASAASAVGLYVKMRKPRK